MLIIDMLTILLSPGMIRVGKEIFKRKTKKSADGAYGGVFVTGKDASGKDLTPIELVVPTYQY